MLVAASITCDKFRLSCYKKIQFEIIRHPPINSARVIVPPITCPSKHPRKPRPPDGASSFSRPASLVRRMRLPYTRSQRFKIVFQHFEGEFLITRPTPAVAVDAADQRLAVTVNLHQGMIAVGAGVNSHVHLLIAK